jgi:hypothetical protein
MLGAEHPGATVDAASSDGKWMVRYPILRDGTVGMPTPVQTTRWLGMVKVLELAPTPDNIPDAFKTVIS